MELVLSILSYKGRRPAEAVSQRFSTEGGTIGRAPASTMVLRDPDQYVSRTHASIEYRGDAFFITALGKNPVEINGQSLPQGQRRTVGEGDEIVIGEYTLEARLLGAAPASRQAIDLPASALHTEAIRSDASIDEPIRTSSEVSAFGVSLFGGSVPQEASPSYAPQQRATQSNHVPAINQPMPAMRPVNTPGAQALLGDWDPFADHGDNQPPQPQAASASESTSPRYRPSGGYPGNGIYPLLRCKATEGDIELPVLNNTGQTPTLKQPSLAELVSAAEQVSEQAPVYNPAQAVRALLAAAGVPDIEETALRDPDLMKLVGELLREAIDGLHRALRVRAATKRELRADQTLMEVAGNNPLKFTPDSTEALRYLLAPRSGTGFLPPVRAVREAFGDVQAHNLAVMAGVRAALYAVFARFDPREVEKRLDKQGMLDKLMPANRKARMWDLMVQLHATSVKEAQDDFDRLFSEAFSKAYQEQMRKLRGNGKAAQAGS